MFTTRPELRGTFGMVSSTHWLASQTGMAILERGGNAFDAAVAAGFVLQVVEPHLNGPGGDLPIILWDARRAKVEVICGQGSAPKAASIRHFQELGLDDIPGTGHLAACVPGAFGAWLMVLGEHGTMRLRDVLQYAIEYASSGYPMVAAIVQAIAQVAPLFRSEWLESARIYLTMVCRCRARRFATRIWAAPTSGSSRRRNGPERNVIARSKPLAASSTRASCPMRS